MTQGVAVAQSGIELGEGDGRHARWVTASVPCGRRMHAKGTASKLVQQLLQGCLRMVQGLHRRKGTTVAPHTATSSTPTLPTHRPTHPPTHPLTQGGANAS